MENVNRTEVGDSTKLLSEGLEDVIQKRQMCGSSCVYTANRKEQNFRLICDLENRKENVIANGKGLLVFASANRAKCI